MPIGHNGYLPDRMRARADRDGLCHDHPIRCAADEVETTLIRHACTPEDVRRAIREARRLWYLYIGFRERFDD